MNPTTPWVRTDRNTGERIEARCLRCAALGVRCHCETSDLQGVVITDDPAAGTVLVEWSNGCREFVSMGQIQSSSGGGESATREGAGGDSDPEALSPTNQARLDVITGLRDLADTLAANPAITPTAVSISLHRLTDAAAVVAWVDETTQVSTVNTKTAVARRRFGPVEVTAHAELDLLTTGQPLPTPDCRPLTLDEIRARAETAAI